MRTETLVRAVLIAAAILCGRLAAPVLSREKGRESDGERMIRSQAKAPYPTSKVITALRWDDKTVRIGNGAGDNWPITWSDGGVQYTAYGDGKGFSRRGPRLTLGFARILGDPPNHRAEDIVSDADTPEGSGPRGIKASGLLMANGVLYLLVRNYRAAGSFRHSKLAWSTDKGKTWTWANWHFSGTFGCPDFVQYGPNYRGARDDYVYVVSQGNDSAYEYSPDVVMARVHKKHVPDRRRYEFFAGTGNNGKPAWSADIEDRKPIFRDPKGTQRLSITYNAALKRYFLTTSHRSVRGTHTPALGVFDAPEPWGPWTTVYYDDHWSGKHVTYHHKFPTKWMSKDGRTMWLLFSGLGGGNYAFCLRKATLEIAAAGPAARSPDSS